MDAADLDYHLPDAAIAQTPVEPRDSARLLVATGHGLEHRVVADLDSLLDPDDVLVVNDTKVIPARLHLRKPTGGAVEVLVLSRLPGGRSWEALVRPGRCFAVVRTRGLEREEVAQLLLKLCDGDAHRAKTLADTTLPAEGRTATLAEVFRRIGEAEARG